MNLDWMDIIDFSQIGISELIELCLKCTREEALRLIEGYRGHCDTPEIADANLGYILGYCNAEDRKKLYSTFPVNHPIFGPSFGRENKDKTGER